MKPMPSRPAQFRALLQKAAIELGLPRKHDVTQALATCRLGRRALRDARQMARSCRSSAASSASAASRDFHAGPHAVLKQLDVSFDPNVGSFRQDAAQRDPHRIDLPSATAAVS
jgi:hypothetical protein